MRLIDRIARVVCPDIDVAGLALVCGRGDFVAVRRLVAQQFSRNQIGDRVIVFLAFGGTRLRLAEVELEIEIPGRRLRRRLRLGRFGWSLSKRRGVTGERGL